MNVFCHIFFRDCASLKSEGQYCLLPACLSGWLHPCCPPRYLSHMTLSTWSISFNIKGLLSTGFFGCGTDLLSMQHPLSLFYASLSGEWVGRETNVPEAHSPVLLWMAGCLVLFCLWLRILYLIPTSITRFIICYSKIKVNT